MKITLFLYILSLQLVSLNAPKKPIFREINHLSDVNPYLDNKTTLIFDISETILSSSGRLIEANSPLTLSSYKKKVESMLSLTQKDMVEADSTLAQLAKHGISFTSLGKTFSGNKYTIQEGVCFSFGTPCASKGRILTGLINDLHLTVEKIVFVDDQDFNLLSVCSSMKRLNIAIDCLLYKKLEDH